MSNTAKPRILEESCAKLSYIDRKSIDYSFLGSTGGDKYHLEVPLG